MSNKREDLQDAFPNPFPNVSERGMTLRDYFANSAMQGHMASEYGAGLHGDHQNDMALAKRYYEIADAMLKQRKNE